MRKHISKYFQWFSKFEYVYIFVLVFGSLLFVGAKANAATYYVSPTGSNTAPYDTWEKAANLPSTVTVYISNEAGAGPHEIQIAAGTYADTINLNHPNHTGLVIQGAGPRSTVLEASATVLTGTVENVSVSDLGILVGGAYKAISIVAPAANWRIVDVEAVSNITHETGLVYVTGENITFDKCGFYMHHEGTEFRTNFYLSGSGSATITESIFAPGAQSKGQGGIATDSSGTLYVYNSIVLATENYGVRVTSGATAYIANCVIQGGLNRVDWHAISIDSGGTGYADNNFLISSPWSYGFVKGTLERDEGNIKTNEPLGIQGYSRHGFILPNVDDSVSFGYAQNWSRLLSEYGMQGTYYIDTRAWQSKNNAALRQVVMDGAVEVGAHSQAHTALTYDDAMTINYSGVESNPTAAFTADRVLQLRTSEGGDNLDINTTSSSYDRLAEIIDASNDAWIITKSTNPDEVQSQISGDVLATSLSVMVSTPVPCDVQFDRSGYNTGLFKDEILDVKSYIADSIINGDGDIIDPQTGEVYETQTFGTPFGLADEAVRDAIRDSGYLFGRTFMYDEMSFLGLTYGARLKLYEAGSINVRYLKLGETEAEIRARARALAQASVDSALIIPVISHNAGELSITEWEWVLDEWSKFDSDVTVTSIQLFAEHIRESGLWVDNGDGTYSRTYEDYTDYSLRYDSPLIDMGTDINLTVDILGNPIYGTPDIGPYEYQPPYTFVANGIPTTGLVRLYSDGKYRMTTASSTTDSANFTVTPAEGSFYATTTQYMDIAINTWTDTEKNWTATSTDGDFLTHATSTVYTIGDLLPDTYYTFKLDGTASTTAIIDNDQCENGVCLSDSSGNLTFTYQGGYSTHTFALEKDVTGPDTFTLSSPANNSSVSNRPTMSWNSTSDSESGLAQYQLYIDDALNRDNISNSADSSSPVNDLFCGSHTWYVKAIDKAGNSTNSNIFTMSLSCGGGGVVQPTSCSTVLYDDWQTICANGWQYRNIKSQNPSGCSITSSQENDRKRQCGTSTAPATETTPTVSAPDSTSEKSVSDSPGDIAWKQILDDGDIIATGDVNQLLSEVGAKRDLSAEVNYSLTIVRSIIGNTLTSEQKRNAITNFVTYGTPTTQSLGVGERAGVVNSFKAAFGKLPETEADWQDVIKIANGRWPGQINKETEKNAEAAFKKIYLRNPNRTNPRDDAAVTIMSYGLRPSARNLESEKKAIIYFKNIYGYSPKTAMAWDIARAIAYSGATR